MPRTGRVVPPNTPHHVIRRGHNRNVVVAHDDDCPYYLDSPREWAQILQVNGVKGVSIYNI
jgi:putative transposase